MTDETKDERQDGPVDNAADAPQEASSHEAPPQEALSLDDLEPRFPGMQRHALARVLGTLDHELNKHPGSFEYAWSELYANRAHVRFALGIPVDLVMEDFLLAARCLSGDPGLHLSRHSEEQLLTRRIRPVEYGILSGNIKLAKRLAINYGVPVAMAQAGMGKPELTREMRILSPGLVGMRLTESHHLLGLAAALYGGAIASAARGYEDEVKLILTLLAHADFGGELSPGEREVMVRYTGLCQALAEVVFPRKRPIGAMLADQIQRYTNRLKNALGLEFLQPTTPQRYIDTGALAVMALAVMTDHPFGEFPPDPAITPLATGYAELLAYMQSHPVVYGEAHDEDEGAPGEG